MFDDESYDEGDKPVLFVGGSSYVGLTVAQALYYFYDVFATYHTSDAPVFYPEFLWYRLDLTSSFRATLERLVRRIQPEFLVNMAAVADPEDLLKSPERAYRVNVAANKIILKVCEGTSTHPILISSEQVFGAKFGPHPEDAPTNPLSTDLYGRHKQEAEQLFHPYLSEGTASIVRVSTLLGPSPSNQRPTWYSSLKADLLAGRPITCSDQTYLTPTHVLNVAFLLNGLMEVLESDTRTKNGGGVFHVPTTTPLTEYELGRAIADSIGTSADLVQAGSPPTQQLIGRAGLTADRTLRLVPTEFLSLGEALAILAEENV